MNEHFSYTVKNGDSPCEPAGPSGGSVTDRDKPQSAINLIDNYAAIYRCALEGASNGRQYFQIPSQLAALVGVAGAAFGGSQDLAVVAGASAATFNSANNYWAPQEKAEVLDAAYNAIECIRMAAVGLDPIDADDPAASTTENEDEVSIQVAWRYYSSIRSALGQVDRVAGSRLRSVGKFDPDGLIAEIEKLNEEIRQAKSDSGEPLEVAGDDGDGGSPAESGNDEDDAGGDNVPATGAEARADTSAGSSPETGRYLVKIPLLQSRLQLCVVKAKI